MPESLELTRERFLPWTKDPLIACEHLHRYAFARELVAGKKVLDLACGEGYGSAILAETAAEVIGVDISPSAVEHAGSTHAGPNLRYLEGSMTAVPLEGVGLFDVIVCLEALEHTSDHEGLMGEVKRLLVEDGVFLVSTPNITEYSETPGLQNPFHVKELGREEFERLLRDSFEHVRIFGQRVFTSSCIFATFDTESSTSSEFAMTRDGGIFSLAPGEQRQPVYFIALASDRPLGELARRSFLLDASDSLLKAKDARIRRLERYRGLRGTIRRVLDAFRPARQW